MLVKAVILIGGNQKGTRFRPLSLDLPKPLFAVAGFPIIQHHIEACVQIPFLKEIIILGYYAVSEMSQFVLDMVQLYKINIRYLQEFEPLGTAGGLYHFRDQIRCGNPDFFFVLNGDVCADFPLTEMLEFHKTHGEKQKAIVTLMATEATRQQSLIYGCIVENKENNTLEHYVEKPSTFISTLINCGVYIFSPEVFHQMANVFNKKQMDFYNVENGSSIEREALYLEKEILMPLAGTGKALVYQTIKWWSQLKTPGAAIYANRHYLNLFRERRPERLAKSVQPTIIGDVYIHATANVHPTAVLGPNVSIGAHATIGYGTRIKESIVLAHSRILDHSLVLYSIIGANSEIGCWTRVEGTPCDPNPDKPFAKMENAPLFNEEGKLNPSITILGNNVTIPSEVIVRNSIVLPHKELTRSYNNEIIL
ncbi:mannose-1-phosphate guanyltransferase alpha-like [Daphnia carinata]|uniref:mannose-1-phosphate guanyltransferase alpha-like n=1 Tax=Daphnia carinata TaxID=120202 RepID=UPI00257A424E|nr:mannose-1-phosphate guanyltransferase alpha-like [Daphnia carinata]